MQVIKFEAVHFGNLQLQPSQKLFQDKLTYNYGKIFEGNSFTILDDNYRVIFTGGLVPIWENRACLWSLIANDVSKHFLYIDRAVRKFLKDNNNNYRRLECYVDPYFKPAVRWMQMLGFKFEGEMQAFMENGNNALLYALINGDK